jgi:hypothetical protein
LTPLASRIDTQFDRDGKRVRTEIQQVMKRHFGAKKYRKMKKWVMKKWGQQLSSKSSRLYALISPRRLRFRHRIEND